MDDHLLDEIKRDIRLLFQLADDFSKTPEEMKNTKHYKAAVVLISTYNKLAKINYGDDYEYLLPSVSKCYKDYKSGNFYI